MKRILISLFAVVALSSCYVGSSYSTEEEKAKATTLNVQTIYNQDTANELPKAVKIEEDFYLVDSQGMVSKTFSEDTFLVFTFTFILCLFFFFIGTAVGVSRD